jgi:membrane protease YdiL (CAAX protease family)
VNRDALMVWARVAALTAFSWATLAVRVPSPPATLPPGAATALGLAAGVALFATVARRAPRLSGVGRPLPATMAKHAFLGLFAVNEELVWRRLVLGETLAAGTVAAVAGSTLGFAFLHRSRRAVHVVTGGTFAGVYVASGSLVASIAAHWTYNTLIAAVVERARAPAVEAPP